jgi:hypothetical protein
MAIVKSVCCTLVFESAPGGESSDGVISAGFVAGEGADGLMHHGVVAGLGGRDFLARRRVVKALAL